MRIARFVLPGRDRSFGAYHRSHGIGVADISQAPWRKSSLSAYNGSCVEFAVLRNGQIGVRDTKDQGRGPTLVFTRPEWAAFVQGARNGEFDV